MPKERTAKIIALPFLALLILLMLTLARDTIAEAARKPPGSINGGSLTCEGAPGDCSGLMQRVNATGSPGKSTCYASNIDLLGLGKKSPRIVESAKLVAYSNFGRREFKISNGPSWSYSGAWDIDNTSLLLTDSPAFSVYHFGLASGLVRQVMASDLSSGSRLMPYTIKQAKDGYVVEEKRGGRLMWLDRDYISQKRLQIKNLAFKDPAGETVIVGSILAWEEASNVVCVFGDIQRRRGGKDQWSSGILKISLPRQGSIATEIKPTKVALIHEIPLESAPRQHARLGFPIMATAKGRIFILLSGANPAIYETGDNFKRLAAFPENYDPFPSSITPDFSENRLLDAYARIEGSQIPVALYGWKDAIYLLGRRPDVSRAGDTVWLLSKIDPDLERPIHTIVLPTASANIVLVPGVTEWAIIEKGRAEGPGNQLVKTIALIPAELPEKGETLGERNAPRILVKPASSHSLGGQLQPGAGLHTTRTLGKSRTAGSATLRPKRCAVAVGAGSGHLASRGKDCSPQRAPRSTGR